VKKQLYSALGLVSGLFLLNRHDDAHVAVQERPKPAAVPPAPAEKEKPRGLVGLLKGTVQSFIDDDCMTMGAALAYYTVFSLAPLMLMVISIAGLALGREAVQHSLVTQIGSLIGPEAAREVQTMLTHATQDTSGGIIGTVVGIVALLAGATGTFASLQDALNRLWRVKPDPNAGGIKAFIGKRLMSFGMILGVAFLLLVSLAVSAALSSFGSWAGGVLPSSLSGGFLKVLNIVVSFLVITLLFGTIFKFLPDAKIEWKGVWPGAAVTSILFTAGKTAIGLYLAKSATASAYGAAGSFVLIIVWLYYASLILLLGAEFTRLWMTSTGDDAPPEPGAVRA